MRTISKQMAILAVFSGVGAAALKCNPFGNGDSPPEVVGPGGSFSVAPCGVVFDVTGGSTDAGQGPSQAFVMIGQMSSGLGAEGLPITVAIGACAGDGGTTVATQLAAAGPGQACGTFDFVPENNGQIELEAPSAGGCTSVTSSLLTCLLRADGTATFSVTATLPMTSTSGLAIPVCVIPNDLRPTQIPVEIASVLDGGSLAVGAPGQLAPSQLGAATSCSNLIPSTALAGFSAGSPPACAIARSAPVSIQLVQNDAGAIAQTLLSADLSVKPQNSGAYLAAVGTACGASSSADVRLTIAPGSSASQNATLCADGRGGTYVLRADSIDDPHIASGNAVIQVSPQPARIAFATLDAGLGVATVFDCTGAPVANLPLAVGTSPSASTDDAGTLLFPLPDGGSSVAVQILSTGQTCQGVLQ
jgi:hypothetical protein